MSKLSIPRSLNQWIGLVVVFGIGLFIYNNVSFLHNLTERRLNF